LATVIWTAILKHEAGYDFRVLIGDRDYSKAKSKIEEKYSGTEVVALVLGQHTTHTFNLVSKNEISCNPLGENDNQPTRGSD